MVRYVASVRGMNMQSQEESRKIYRHKYPHDAMKEIEEASKRK